MNETGWFIPQWEFSSSLTLQDHVCFAVDNGVIAMTGRSNSGGSNMQIYLLKNDYWRTIGETTKASSIHRDPFIDRFLGPLSLFGLQNG